MMKYIFKPANLFTAASLFCGVYSLMLSAGAEPSDSRQFFTAALLIVMAGFFDGLDGRVARMTRTESEFGMQLDSLVDVVSFGVAPGVLVYKWGLEALGQLGFVVAFLFILCGAFRLARFNIDAGSEEPPDKRYSQGLTITWAGGLVAVLVLHHTHTRSVPVENHLGVLLLALVLAYLMISTVRFRTFKELRRSPATTAGIMAFAAAAVTIFALYGITSLLVVLGFAYIGAGLLEEMLFFTRRRRADDAFYLDDPALDEEQDEEEEVVVH